MMIYDDLCNTPGLIFDVVVDVSLLAYIALKLSTFFFPHLAKAESVGGACVVMCLWVTGFMKLSITKSVGPFVIFMKYAQQDLKKVITMFMALFVPAFLVFYKTIYVTESGEKTEEGEGDEAGRQTRAAKPKGRGGGAEIDTFVGLSELETFFRVLRMVLGDYDYEEGLARYVLTNILC
eukprot:sb/3479365/